MSESPQTPVNPPWPRVKPRADVPDPMPEAGFETLCARYAEDPTRQFGAAAPPIYQTSTFMYPDAQAFQNRRSEDSPHYDYSRVGNPTNAILEAKLARLERAAWADTFGCGMGAISATINACVEKDTHVICAAHCYGPARMYLDHLRRFGVETSYIAGVDPGAFIDAIRPNTRLIYLESPTSGMFEVIDLPPIIAAARERGVLTAFDNSWASPYFMNPLELGVDLVVHSASKYLNGHSDVVAGVVLGRDESLRRRIWRELELGGAMLDPFAAWLMLRGLRTLALRMQRHQQSGLTVARMLETHPAVSVVRHPGLPSHPQHETARRQLRGWSGLFSLSLHDGTPQATQRVLNRLKLFGIGVSWGGYESLALGGALFKDGTQVIRLSIGLENADDLIADLRAALDS